MGDKKGKSLALELIDDLLNEKSEVVQESKLKPPAPAPAGKPAKARVEPEDDKTIDVSSGNGDQQLVTPRPGPMPKAGEEDRTVPLNEQNNRNAPTIPIQGGGDSNPRTTVGRPNQFRSGAPNATEAALAQSESLRIAQSRILELEQELERLRLQNEELAAAGETLRRRADELSAEGYRRESDMQHQVSTFEQEKGILTGSKEALQRDVQELKRKNEELDLRISNSVQKIRVRERELENRLELVKMESAALIRSKDELILDLKRQIDTLNLELNNYRAKNQELNRLTNDKQEMLRRTVKALRLALSMLEGEEEAPKMKKVK